MKQALLSLAFAASLAAQNAGIGGSGGISGAAGLDFIPPAVQSGLTGAWLFNGATTPVDLVGNTGALAYNSGSSATLTTGPGTTNQLSIVGKSSGVLYVATPSNAYVAVSAAALQMPTTAIATWGDGNPHSIVGLYYCDTLQYYSSGSQPSCVVMEKPGEYEVTVGNSASGLIQLLTGTSLGTSVTAYSPCQSSGSCSSYIFTQANQYPVGGWHLIMISTTGGSSASTCIDVDNNNNPQCSTTTITTSAYPLSFAYTGHIQYVLTYNRVLGATDKATLWNSGNPLIPPFTFNPANQKTLQIAGSSLISGNGWGSTYTNGSYTIPSPYSYFSVTTNSPVLSLNIQSMQSSGATGSAQELEISCYLNNGTWTWNPLAQIFPTNLGSNTAQIGLPSGTNIVTCDAGSFVGYSSSDTTPTTNMTAAAVQSVSVPYGFTLSGVTPPSVTNAMLILGDSISICYGCNFPPDDAYPAQLRNSGLYAGNIEFEAYGGRALYHSFCPAGTCSSGAATAFADTLKTRWGCPANFLVQEVTNDYGRALISPANLQTYMGSFWTEWIADCPSTTNYQQMAFYRGTETANGLGYTMPQYRTAMSNAAGAASPAVTILNSSMTGYPAVGNNCSGGPSTAPEYASDSLHLTSCGQFLAYEAVFGPNGMNIAGVP